MNISDYGLIGNCRSSALVSRNGSIDWCCLPDFDSPSIFARLIDEEKGGSFSILPLGNYQITQTYLDHTNILKTTFTAREASFEVIDFMPIYRTDESHYYNAPEIYRIIRVRSGAPVIRACYRPLLNYARATKGFVEENYFKHVTTERPYTSVYLYTDFPLETISRQEEIRLTGNHFFCVTYNQKLIRTDYQRAYLEYQRTKVYWMNWAKRTYAFPKYQEEIVRSALVLKLLSYDQSGAIVAAPTTSLPEAIGEVRNWDYRFCWIRDASMVIKTFLMVGHTNSARKFQNFILRVHHGKQEDIQIMYGIRGEKNLEETVLEHLAGYRHSTPVRIGNGAFSQKQNDIYGILIDTIYLSLQKFPSTLDTSEELWTFVRSILAVVEKDWQKPDKGIWEMRGPDRHFVYSKLMSWVAFDRGEKIALMFGKKSYSEKWNETASGIRGEILDRGWNDEVKAFVQYYGSADLDASNLLMEEFGLVEATDPRYISTVLQTREKLVRNGLVFRYVHEDDFGKPSGSFVLCNFWLINSLYRIGLVSEARELFENVLTHANHLNLLSEHIDIVTHELLGNFPQAYSHLGLIQSALLLNGREISFDSDIFRYIKP
ncbi:MAG: glycoside hydrolase family 15 protein [Prolixibacteraceae bacterium]|nr:glycoside hydrolase family 15 protein [Prolixibacteraceae bacterium]